MRVDVLTIFPRMFAGPLDESILGRAREAGVLDLHIHDLRAWATDRHRTTDDAPYGGGAGMVMRAEPLVAAVEALATPEAAVVLLSPQGRLLSQAVAAELAQRSHLVLLCGRYEGFDERVREHLATDEVSIGDYVVTGGELPAMVLIDAVARLVPGVLGSEASLREESHTSGLLEYPHYTRPLELRGWTVPEILLSGNHGAIARWRREQSLLRTLRIRPDLLVGAALTSDDRRFLATHGASSFLRPEDLVEPRRRRRSARVVDSEVTGER